MLTELRIKNFAIIESLTLPLARGFNVLSGETGAGKSIVVGGPDCWLTLKVKGRYTTSMLRVDSCRWRIERK